ncbi:MAG: hypothetical protein LBR12_00550 [Opitutaceae bacterium]|jgi:hypothetical protein|nr:hypothetical protein [Opitutaceae bacterium]
MRNLDDPPALPKLPFIIGDAVLVTAAVLVAVLAPTPLPQPATLVILACAGLGAVLLAIPFVSEHIRRREAAAAALERRVGGQTQALAEIAGQLAAAADRIGDGAASIEKLERLADALGQEAEDPGPDLNETARFIADEAARRLEASLKTRETGAAERVAAALKELAAKSEALGQAAAGLGKLAAQAAALEQAAVTLGTLADKLRQPAAADNPPPEEAEAVKIPKPRKPKKAPPPASDEAVDDGAGDAVADDNPPPEEAGPDDEAPDAPGKAAPEPDNLPPEASAAEPEKVEGDGAVEPPADKPPPEEAGPDEAAPAVPGDAPEPAADNPPPEEAVSPASEPVDEPAPAKAPKPRAKKSRDKEPTLEMDLGIAEPEAEPLRAEKFRSTDGATRLVATAYIGIGNKLFIRGEGAGLSPDKGVPLKFVSIGKWSWETEDADAPIRARLYKNDQLACETPGEFTLEPGCQHELTVRF